MEKTEPTAQPDQPFLPCPNHPDQPQVVVKSGPRAGQLTGFCRLCYQERCRQNRIKYKENKKRLAEEEKKAAAFRLTVDFADHPDLLETVNKLAEEDLRTVNNQILWMLRQQSM